jgi:hypothetical protein
VSGAQPYVSGKRVMLGNHSQSCGGPTTLGMFSSHWAAVAALVRLRQPDFKSLSGDKQEDLDKEPDMRAALAKATGQQVGAA